MFQQYILQILAGALILFLLFGVLLKRFKDFISVLFDVPDNSDEGDSQ